MKNKNEERKSLQKLDFKNFDYTKRINKLPQKLILINIRNQ
jgi:hypothetical protein